MPNNSDIRWLDAAAQLAERAIPASRPNPCVAAIIVSDNVVVGRGWTQAGGRPHAEAIALKQAGEAAKNATLYVTLEPCAHRSTRGPACADLVANSGLSRVVIGVTDPDPRTAGKGIEQLRQAGIIVEVCDHAPSRASLAPFLTRQILNRPFVTLKLALSANHCIASGDRQPIAITGEIARAHVHRQRARVDAILVGGGTFRADNPSLNVRLAGLEDRSPRRIVLTSRQAPEGWQALASPQAIADLADVQHLYVEGGAGTATAFLKAGLVDQIMLYHGPNDIDGGLPAPTGLPRPSALGDWCMTDQRQLGSDRVEVYAYAIESRSESHIESQGN